MFLFLTKQQIINSWENIINDSYFPKDKYKTPDEFINDCINNIVLIGGAQVVICNSISLS